VKDKKEAVKMQGENENLDILSILVKSGSFSDDELVSQMLTFLAAVDSAVQNEGQN
jgi:cytochrome P450